MSRRFNRSFALGGLNLLDYTEAQLLDLFRSLLENGIHGICFSAYEEGQSPGDQVTEELVRRRLKILQPYIKWVRSFSCVEGNELIPIVAKELGIKTLVGAWIGKDQEMNEEELQSLIKLAKDGYVDIAAVGNEVLYRKDCDEEQLLEYIRRVKTEITDIPVGYVDAYYEFAERPSLAEISDVILANCYPYWEGCHIDYALVYMQQMYAQALHAGQGKKVIITETGWPSQGGGLDGAHAGRSNSMKYFIDSISWSNRDDIEMFYFSSFDESWKVGPEGDVGAYWGIWDKNEKLKF